MDYINSFKKLIKEINSKSNIKVPYDIAGIIDISTLGIKQKIDNFSLYLESKNRSFRHVWPIVAPFFLSIGDGVYKARKELVSELSKREDGQKLWEEIIKHLSIIERDSKTDKRDPLPEYKAYPQKLKDAESFFKLKD